MDDNDRDERLQGIEAGFVRQWRNMGLWPGATLHDDSGLLWFETPIPHLPYNGIIRTAIPPELDAHAVIARVVSSLRERSWPFYWICWPTRQPEDLPGRLAQLGLDLVERVTGMDLDLDAWSPDRQTSDARIVKHSAKPTCWTTNTSCALTGRCRTARAN